MAARYDSTIAFDVWGQRGWYSFDVAGESFHSKDIERLFPGKVPDGGGAVEIEVQLVPEPTNRYDRNAVKVMAGPAHVGYIPRDLAGAYQPVLSELIAAGYAPQCGAQVRAWPEYEVDVDKRGGVRQRRTGVSANVRLDLAEPHMLVPLNAAPSAAHAVLPVGSAVQVTGEELHMGTLRAWTRPTGEAWVHVSLHKITEQLARSTRDVVEVRIDGEPVGQLTPKMSSEYSPAIDLLEESGVQTAARAVVKGNTLEADVVLYAAKAGELGEDWLRASVGTAKLASSQSANEPLQVVETQAHGLKPEVEPQPSVRVAPPAVQMPPAGWFADPSVAGGLRWWDGTAWTEYRAMGSPAAGGTAALPAAASGDLGSQVAVRGRDSSTPVTRASLEGYLIEVEYDERSLRVRGKNALARAALTGPDHGKGDVVIPRDDIARVTFQAANPLVNGKVVVTTSDGHTYQLHFRRKQQVDFERLARDLGA